MSIYKLLKKTRKYMEILYTIFTIEKPDGFKLKHLKPSGYRFYIYKFLLIEYISFLAAL